MKLLVIGSGGREHALVWKLHQSPLAEKIYCAPGNAGIAEIATCVDIEAENMKGLVRFAKRERIDLTVIGPEAPLVEGIVDEFEAQSLAIFGPTKYAAAIEGSKVFAKDLMRRYGIPTAHYETFDDPHAALAYVSEGPVPIVVKADGLAAGKGSVVCRTREEAIEAVEQIMVHKTLGESGRRIVVEEFLEGEEVSVMALTDGEAILLLPPAQDHKPLYDGDEGPNTGGMGAYAPAPVLDPDLTVRVREEIFEPTIDALVAEGRPYRGVLYAGLMITRDGPKVLEFNCRFGDPETQVVLPLIKSDLLEACLAVGEGKLSEYQLRIAEDHWALCVVMASAGYPGPYEKGKEILGLDDAWGDDIFIFHAGTRYNGDRIVTAGGRVLGVTAAGQDLIPVRERAYQAVGKITFDGAYYRKDIGYKALKRLAKIP